MSKRILLPLTTIALLGTLAGCGGKPSDANIKLRKENGGLRDEVASLKLQHDADQASLQSLQSSVGSIPNLPPDRLGKLFTVHGLKFGRLSGGADLDSGQPGDEGIKIDVIPTDEDGDTIKAAGSFVIEAFDLGEADRPLLGRWTFDTAQSRKAWYSGGLLYEYVFTIPWTTRPTHPELTLKVTFTDDLTRRQFTAQKVFKIVLPPATMPANNPGQ